jgi:hypothetical protein
MASFSLMENGAETVLEVRDDLEARIVSEAKL